MELSDSSDINNSKCIIHSRDKECYCVTCNSNLLCLDCFFLNHQGVNHKISLVSQNNSTNELTINNINQNGSKMDLKSTEYDERLYEIEEIKASDEMLKVVSSLKPFFTNFVSPLTAEKCALELVARDICNTKLLFRLINEHDFHLERLNCGLRTLQIDEIKHELYKLHGNGNNFNQNYCNDKDNNNDDRKRGRNSNDNNDKNINGNDIEKKRKTISNKNNDDDWESFTRTLFEDDWEFHNLFEGLISQRTFDTNLSKEQIFEENLKKICMNNTVLGTEFKIIMFLDGNNSENNMDGISISNIRAWQTANPLRPGIENKYPRENVILKFTNDGEEKSWYLWREDFFLQNNMDTLNISKLHQQEYRDLTSKRTFWCVLRRLTKVAKQREVHVYQRLKRDENNKEIRTGITDERVRRTINDLKGDYEQEKYDPEKIMLAKTQSFNLNKDDYFTRPVKYKEKKSRSRDSSDRNYYGSSNGTKRNDNSPIDYTHDNSPRDYIHDNNSNNSNNNNNNNNNKAEDNTHFNNHYNTNYTDNHTYPPMNDSTNDMTESNTTESNTSSYEELFLNDVLNNNSNRNSYNNSNSIIVQDVSNMKPIDALFNWLDNRSDKKCSLSTFEQEFSSTSTNHAEMYVKNFSKQVGGLKKFLNLDKQFTSFCGRIRYKATSFNTEKSEMVEGSIAIIPENLRKKNSNKSKFKTR